MKARPVALLAIIVAAATVAEVFHALRRRAQDSQLRQIPAALDQQLAETRPTERTCTGYATPSTRCTSTSIPCQKERRKLPPKPLNRNSRIFAIRLYERYRLRNKASWRKQYGRLFEHAPVSCWGNSWN